MTRVEIGEREVLSGGAGQIAPGARDAADDVERDDAKMEVEPFAVVLVGAGHDECGLRAARTCQLQLHVSYKRRKSRLTRSCPC